MGINEIEIKKNIFFAQDSDLCGVINALSHLAICEVIFLFSLMNFIVFFLH